MTRRLCQPITGAYCRALEIAKSTSTSPLLPFRNSSSSTSQTLQALPRNPITTSISHLRYVSREGTAECRHQVAVGIWTSACETTHHSSPTLPTSSCSQHLCEPQISLLVISALGTRQWDFKSRVKEDENLIFGAPPRPSAPLLHSLLPCCPPWLSLRSCANPRPCNLVMFLLSSVSLHNSR